MGTFGSRLKHLRKSKKLTQKNLADIFKLAESTISMYERDEREPSFELTNKLADYFGVTTDYLHGRTDYLHGRTDYLHSRADIGESAKKVEVVGKEIILTPEEHRLFEELKKHPIMFHDLSTDPEKKVKELIKLYKMKKILDEEDEDEEHGDGFGELD